MSHGLFYRCPYYVSGLWTLQFCCCLCRVRKLSDFIKNILIYVPKMNEGLMGWNNMRRVINDRIFIFGWTNPLKKFACSGDIIFMKIKNIYSCFVKSKSQQSLLQSWGSHDPSEIFLICWFGAQEHFLLLSMLKTVVLLQLIFLFFRILWWEASIIKTVKLINDVMKIMSQCNKKYAIFFSSRFLGLV